mmetsp:Transcript_11762/g.25454  ORF Transcript_11762/g.25454 Transcript_11762/m.25454 type:complete len:242 (+) Transcript_11762:335-1060(+)
MSHQGLPLEVHGGQLFHSFDIIIVAQHLILTRALLLHQCIIIIIEQNWSGGEVKIVLGERRPCRPCVPSRVVVARCLPSSVIAPCDTCLVDGLVLLEDRGQVDVVPLYLFVHQAGGGGGLHVPQVVSSSEAVGQVETFAGGGHRRRGRGEAVGQAEISAAVSSGRRGLIVHQGSSLECDLRQQVIVFQMIGKRIIAHAKIAHAVTRPLLGLSTVVQRPRQIGRLSGATIRRRYICPPLFAS